MATNPMINQGVLNRIRSSVVVPNHTGLNVPPSYMGQNFVSVSFEGDFAKLIQTATGAIQSPEPYVMANIQIDLLRTQSLSSDWVSQAKTDSYLGEVVVHPDSGTFPKLEFHDAVIQQIDPGQFDGQNPVAQTTLNAVYYINNSLWSVT